MELIGNEIEAAYMVIPNHDDAIRMLAQYTGTSRRTIATLLYRRGHDDGAIRRYTKPLARRRLDEAVIAEQLRCKSVSEIATEYGVSRQTIYNLIKEYKHGKQSPRDEL